MERGQVLECRPGRVVLRNLRGWLMSVPVRTDASTDPSACPAGAQR